MLNTKTRTKNYDLQSSNVRGPEARSGLPNGSCFLNLCLVCICKTNWEAMPRGLLQKNYSFSRLCNGSLLHRFPFASPNCSRQMFLFLNGYVMRGVYGRKVTNVELKIHKNASGGSWSGYGDPTPPPSPIFNDDEPIAVPPAAAVLPNFVLEKIKIGTFTEFPAVAASCSNPYFAVLLGIHAPPRPTMDAAENRRVPTDLVAVLDVSGSMSGKKLSLLKSATKFVIGHMLPSDRLSIVSFASEARRVLPLRRMTERGRKDAEYAVDLLRANGCTDIKGGLNMGAQVLEQRRECNPVSSIIFLSDGEDTVNRSGYLKSLSSSISSYANETSEEGRGKRFPVYTFGLGMDHDAVVMNAIADGSAGTYSFVESAEMIPTSFARCIGGLFSVVAQDVRVSVWSASPGVEIISIPSGRHRKEIISQQKQGIIHVGDLFAEEKKEFLVYLSVPPAAHSDGDDQMVTWDEAISRTPLLDVVCYYSNAFTEEIVQIDCKSIEINRPVDLSPTDKVVDLAVDRQRNRVEVAESIAKAKELADKGNLKAAKELLTHCNETLLASASAQSGVENVNWLQVELKEITARMGNMRVYDRHGRPFMLAGLSAHDAQRATTRNHTFMQDGCAVDSSDDDDDGDYCCDAGGWDAADCLGDEGGWDGKDCLQDAVGGWDGKDCLQDAVGGWDMGSIMSEDGEDYGYDCGDEEEEEVGRLRKKGSGGRGGGGGGVGMEEIIAAGKACVGAYDTPFMIELQKEVENPKKDDD